MHSVEGHLRAPATRNHFPAEQHPCDWGLQTDDCRSSPAQVETGTLVVVRRNPYNRCLTSSTNLKKQEKWTSINQLGDTNHQQHPPNTGSNDTTVQQPVPVQRVPIQSVPLLSVSDESQTVSHQVESWPESMILEILLRIWIRRKRVPHSLSPAAHLKKRFQFRSLSMIKHFLLHALNHTLLEGRLSKTNVMQAVEESPVIIQRQHNIQHNGLRVRSEKKRIKR